MIKKMNKVTSLLIAAAAVVSLIPATGVNAADRLETREGTIDSAVAFNGGYIYNGYKTDTDETGVYFNSGDADKLIEDLDSATLTRYGKNYVIADDGDEYLVDLSTGKVLEDETSEDRKDTLKSKLKSTLSKTERYDKVVSSEDVVLNQISNDQFGDIWYSYEVTTSGGAVLEGYTNEAGKYIDTDVTANISVFNGTRMVKVENFGEMNKDYNITVNLVDAETIAQDNDYIYRIVDVNVTDATTTSAAKYIQKISKAQGEKEDDAYLPKTVASYEITYAFDSGNADDAATTLADISNADIRVINGVIYITKNNADDSEVTVTTINLKKDKVTADGKTSKLDVYLAEQDVNESQDIMGENAVSIDADGNTWALNKGEIFKFDGKEFKVVYNVDRAMDTLEVYSADNLIAWENGEDVYAIVDKEATETPVETPVTTTGWVKTASGWTFFKADGSQVKGQWVQDGGVWYMIKADGIMATGWYNDNGTWYFLAGSGAMKTGWVLDGSTWYFLQSSGAMKTGWLNDNGTWYFLNASGAMLANTSVDGYKLNASGAWVK